MNKNIIILLVVAVVAIAIVCGVYVSGFITSEETGTPFNNNIMSGKFVGNVSNVKNPDNWSASYFDKVNNIEYNMSSVKNASFLVEFYSLQGWVGPEHRTYNDQDWDIYSTTGKETNNTNASIQLYMCVANKENQSYIIYVIFHNPTEVSATNDVFCDAFEGYVAPLLSSLTLKHNSTVPALNEIFGVDQAVLDNSANLVKEAKKGNYTAYQQLVGTA